MAVFRMCGPLPTHHLRLDDSRDSIPIDSAMDNVGVSQRHLLFHLHIMAAVSMFLSRLLAMRHYHRPFASAVGLSCNKDSR